MYDFGQFTLVLNLIASLYSDDEFVILVPKLSRTPNGLQSRPCAILTPRTIANKQAQQLQDASLSIIIYKIILMKYKGLHYISVISPISDNKDSNQASQMSNKNSTIKRSTQIFSHQLNKRRPVSLSFNLGKIMPKTITYDKESLYEENIKLKESLKYLHNQVAKLRTQINISENQTQKIIEVSYSDHAKSISGSQLEKKESGRSGVSRPINSKISWMYLQSQHQIKKQLKKAKQQLSMLKFENDKLRKSLKYTQIQQLTIENERMKEQCIRIKNLVQNRAILVINGNSNQKEIKNAREQIAKLKQNNAHISAQLKAKIKEIDLLRNELNFLKQKETKWSDEIKELKLENSKLQDNISEKNNIIYHHRNRAAFMTSPEQSPGKQKSIETKLKKLEDDQKFLDIKTILTFRFKSQRYTYKDFEQDIMQSKFQFFNQQQIQHLFKAHPFSLKNESLAFVLKYIFDSQKKQIGVSQLNIKIRNLIEQFDLISQKNQQQYLKKWQKILKNPNIKSKTKLNIPLKSQYFKKWIYELQIKPQQMEFLLGEAAMVSDSLNSINVQDFIAKISEY